MLVTSAQPSSALLQPQGAKGNPLPTQPDPNQTVSLSNTCFRLRNCRSCSKHLSLHTEPEGREQSSLPWVQTPGAVVSGVCSALQDTGGALGWSRLALPRALTPCCCWPAPECHWPLALQPGLLKVLLRCHLRGTAATPGSPWGPGVSLCPSPQAWLTNAQLPVLCLLSPGCGISRPQPRPSPLGGEGAEKQSHLYNVSPR